MPDIRGLKRTCASCATKFYDFNKSPIFCPKCNTEFTGIVKVRTRRGRNVIEDAKAKSALDGDDDTVEIVEDDEVGVVSLEEIGEEEDKDVDDEDDAGGDLDLDDLEDDEDDDDLEDLEDDLEIEKE
jgi:uncharacterized protein (TIGR02300 family)